MSKIKVKEEADLIEGLRLSFNAAMFRNLFRSKGGSQYHDEKLKSEDLLDKWLKKNIEGLPDEEMVILTDE